MTLLRFFIFNLSVLFLGTINIKSRYFKAKKTLFRKHSFRISKSSRKDIFICFKYLYKSLLLLKSKKDEPLRNQLVGNGCLIFDGNNQIKEDRLNYISSITQNNINEIDYVSIGNLSGIGLGYALFFTSVFSLVFIPVLFISFFHPNRHILALYIASLIKSFLLVKYSKKRRIQKIYYFFPFENDANLNALVLMSFDIKVIKVPGPNSLFRFHQYMLSDEVIFNSAYQADQYEVLKDNWDVKEVNLRPIYGYNLLLSFFIKKENNYKCDIGFISSGIWRREELGLDSFEEGDYESEKTLIKWLNEYFESCEIQQLFIYLHPIEKKNFVVYNQAIDFYKRNFKNCELYFGEFKKKSYEEFEYVNVSVSAQSTTNIQRLFCGYKALYTPMKFKKPVFNNSKLENICFKDKNRFLKELKKTIKISENDFFERNKLKKFHHNHYNL